MSAREEILDRIRTALADRPAPPPVTRSYRSAGGTGDVQRFVQRVTDYRATVHEASDSVADTVTAVLASRNVTQVVVPDGFPDHWVPGGVEVVAEPVGVAALDAIGAVVTTCALAIGETGTIVLDGGPGMGSRAASLVPDYHLVVMRVDQIVAGVPDAIAALDPTRPMTWISGPSATSDIELQRVEGVHGPRTLDVVVAR